MSSTTSFDAQIREIIQSICGGESVKEMVVHLKKCCKLQCSDRVRGEGPLIRKCLARVRRYVAEYAPHILDDSDALTLLYHEVIPGARKRYKPVCATQEKDSYEFSPLDGHCRADPVPYNPKPVDPMGDRSKSLDQRLVSIGKSIIPPNCMDYGYALVGYHSEQGHRDICLEVAGLVHQLFNRFGRHILRPHHRNNHQMDNLSDEDKKSMKIFAEEVLLFYRRMYPKYPNFNACITLMNDLLHALGMSRVFLDEFYPSIDHLCSHLSTRKQSKNLEEISDLDKILQRILDPVIDGDYSSKSKLFAAIQLACGRSRSQILITAAFLKHEDDFKCTFFPEADNEESYEIDLLINFDNFIKALSSLRMQLPTIHGDSIHHTIYHYRSVLQKDFNKILDNIPGLGECVRITSTILRCLYLRTLLFRKNISIENYDEYQHLALTVGCFEELGCKINFSMLRFP